MRAGTPPDALARLEAAHRAAMETRVATGRLRRISGIAIPTDTAGSAACYRPGVARWTALVRRGSVKRIEGS